MGLEVRKVISAQQISGFLARKLLREIVELTESVLDFYNDPIQGGIHFTLQIIIIANAARSSQEEPREGYLLRITYDSGLFQGILFNLHLDFNPFVLRYRLEL